MAALAWGIAAAAVLLMVVAELTRPLAEAAPLLDVADVLPPEATARAEAFRGPRRVILLLRLVVVFLLPAVVLAHRRMRQRLARLLGAGPAAEPRRLGVLRAGLAGAAAWALLDVVVLPLSIAAFLDSRAEGLATQPLAGFLRDWLVVNLLTWVGVGLGVAALLELRRRRPSLWVPVGGIAGGLVAVVLIVVSPLVFEPLLLRFEPLTDPQLRAEITELVERAEGSPPEELLVADASRRSTVRNAYVSGLGATRRVVVYDTLLVGAPAADVINILAHEIGHDAHADIGRSAAGAAGAVVLLLLGVAVLTGDLGPGRRLGHSAGRPDGDLALRAVAAVLLLSVLVMPVERWSSRRAEAAADAYAVELTGNGPAYADMMRRLAEANVTDPDPPPWVVVLVATHPTVRERVSRAVHAP